MVISESHILFPRKKVMWKTPSCAVLWILGHMNDVWFVSEDVGQKHCWTIHRFWHGFISTKNVIFLSAGYKFDFYTYALSHVLFNPDSASECTQVNFCTCSGCYSLQEPASLMTGLRIWTTIFTSPFLQSRCWHFCNTTVTVDLFQSQC